MPITFSNLNLGLGRKDIKFSGEVTGHRDPIICSIDRLSLAAYSKSSHPDSDEEMSSAFDIHRLLINACAAAQWRAGNNRPRVSYDDLISYPIT